MLQRCPAAAVLNLVAHPLTSTLLVSPTYYLSTPSHPLSSMIPFGTIVGGFVPSHPSPSPDALCDASVCVAEMVRGATPRVMSDGAVGVILDGNVAMDAVVCDGTQALAGSTMTVTESDGDVIVELDGEPAFARFSHYMESTLGSGSDGAIAPFTDHRCHLMVGVEVDGESFQAAGVGEGGGDGGSGGGEGEGEGRMHSTDGKDASDDFPYVIRAGLQQADTHHGPGMGLRVPLTEYDIPTNTRLQLRVFGPDQARDNFTTALEQYTQHGGGTTAAGGLLVSCLGRGPRLYEEVGFEPRSIEAILGTGDAAGVYDNTDEMDVDDEINERTSSLPLLGFFAGGEIGPVERRTYTHSFTSCLAVFRAKKVGGQSKT